MGNEAAFSFLLDENNIAAHVLRRYIRRELVHKMEKVVFSIVRATHTDSVLFMAVAAIATFKRWLKSLGRIDKSRAATCVRQYPRVMNYLPHNPFVAEYNALRWYKLPLGISVSVLGEKR